jgi:hypothetical protein
MIEAVIEPVTPDSARAMLANMVVNRPLKERRVELFATAMKEGVFDSMNGETLIINEYGQLEDGQHRLSALIESGLPYMDFFVVRGVRVGAGTTVDQGTARSPGDIAAMMGYENGKTLVAAARWLWVYENAWPTGLHRLPGLIPTQTLIKFLEQHRRLTDVTAEIRSKYSAVGRLATSSVAIFVRYVTEAISQEQSDAFFDSLQTGDTTHATRMTRPLRDKLLARNSKSGRLNGSEIIVITTKVWNAMRENRELAKLYVSRYDDPKQAFAQAPRFK